MGDTDFSLLDVPRSAPPDDPEAYLRAAIAWHFGEDTGCRFWLRTARTLNFNPLNDIKTFADLLDSPAPAPSFRCANCGQATRVPFEHRSPLAACPGYTCPV